VTVTTACSENGAVTLSRVNFSGKKERKKHLFATNNNGIKQEKQRNNTEVSSQQAARKAKSHLCWPPTLLILLH